MPALSGLRRGATPGSLLLLSVIAMRENRLDSYDPGLRCPLYPWMQLAGVTLPFVFIAEMVWLPVIFSIGIAAVSIGWYRHYACIRLVRDGAIYHVFERMGRVRSAGVERQWRGILKQMGSRTADSFDEVVGRAFLVDESGSSKSLEPLIATASRLLSRRLPVTPAQLADGFKASLERGDNPVRAVLP